MCTNHTNQKEESASFPKKIDIDSKENKSINYYGNRNNIITVGILICFILLLMLILITFKWICSNNCFEWICSSNCFKWILLVMFLTLMLFICCTFIVCRYHLKMKKEHQSLMNKELDIISCIENKKFDLKYYQFYIDKKKKEQDIEIEYKKNLLDLEIEKREKEQLHEIKLKLIETIQTINNNINNVNIENLLKEKETIKDNNKETITEYINTEKINNLINKYMSYNKELMASIKSFYKELS